MSNKLPKIEAAKNIENVKTSIYSSDFNINILFKDILK